MAFLFNRIQNLVEALEDAQLMFIVHWEFPSKYKCGDIYQGYNILLFRGHKKCP